MRPSGIGGQAVLEGVMMKNREAYAVAVRKPDGQIAVEKGESHSVTEKYPVLGLPFIRGVVSFVESMVLGMRTLTFSAGFFEEETEEPSAFEKKLTEKLGNKAEKVMMGCTVAASIVLAIAIFMLLPFGIASLLERFVTSDAVLTLIEGLIRIIIFIGYVLAISMMKDIRRVFMYHGAEHKSINCIEHGLPLTVANVKKQSTRHKRCGTSFMLFVILISVVFFMFIRVENVWLRMLFRVLLIPVIAGVSYELIKLAGRSENKVVAVLSKPGLWLQGLTTREPDDSMIEVAIQSVEAVFDWQTFLAEEPKKKAGSDKKRETKKTNAKKEETKKTESKKVLEKTSKKAGVSKTKDQPVKEEKKSTKSIEHAVERVVENDEDDDILNALDRFFTYKKEESAAAEAKKSKAAGESAATEEQAEGEQP